MRPLVLPRRRILSSLATGAAAAALPIVSRAAPPPAAGAPAASSPAAGARGTPSLPPVTFPKEFLFGVGTSAYQIEGSPTADGKGESIWDRWSRLPGKVKIPGDVAADHYRRYKEDVELLKVLGVNTYRFSIAWTRIFPDGVGAVNPKGIAFYKDLVRRLRAAGIQPMVTLYHWDLPQKLQERGGWMNRDIVAAFEAYARTMYEALGEDVTHWTTFNEPWVAAFLGHNSGRHPPGLQDFPATLLCVHHMNLAHGRAVETYRRMKLPGQMGVTLDLQYTYPASDKAEDRAAADRKNRGHHAIFAEPMLKGRYPEDIWRWLRSKDVPLPAVSKEDARTIHQPLDFLGLNYYYATKTRHAPGESWPWDVKEAESEAKKYLVGASQPHGLYDLLRRLDREYGTKIIVTENGYHQEDRVNLRGEVIDDARIEYLYQHLAACRRAMDDGVKLAGYIHWTFMDNYEWGNWSRMGLVYTDFQSQKRIVKKSGTWFRDGIRGGFRL